MQNIAEYLRRNKLHAQIFARPTPGPYAGDYGQQTGQADMDVARKLFEPPLSDLQPEEAPTPDVPDPMDDPNYRSGQTFGSSYSKRDVAAENARDVISEHIPDKRDYRPSVGRKILGVLAGVGKGYLMGPAEGFRTAERVANPEYTRAMDDYTKRRTQVLDKNQFEMGQEKFQTDEDLARAKREAELNRSGAERNRAESEIARKYKLISDANRPVEWKAPDEEAALRIIRAKNEKPVNTGVKPEYEIETSDGKKIIAGYNHQTGRFVDTVTGTEISKDAIDPDKMKKFGVNETEKNHNPYNDKVQDFIATNGRKPTGAELDAINRSLGESRMPPIVLQGLQLSNENKALDAADKRLTHNNDTIQMLLAQGEANPRFFENDKNFATPAQKQQVMQLYADKNGSVPQKLPPEMERREISAEQTKNHTQVVRKLFADPELQAYLGPASGRLTEVLNKLGSGAIMAPDSVKKKAKELQSRITILTSQEAASLGGRGGTDQLRRALAETAPKLSNILPVAIGSLDAIEGAADQVLAQANQYRRGKSGKDNSLKGLLEELKNANGSRTVTR